MKFSKSRTGGHVT